MRFFTSAAFTPRLPVLARAADEAGYYGMTVPDHVVYPETIESVYPGSPSGKPYWGPDDPWPDTWVTVGAMAAVTKRLHFINSIYILPLRHPFVVAKAVSTAAVLSEGRVILGAGLGWMREEYEAMGQDYRTRGRRSEEMIEVMRLLWSSQMVEFHGRFYDFPPMQMSPPPPSPIPIFLGGRSDAALERTARLADGYISGVHSWEQVDDLAVLVDHLRRLRQEKGRADQPFTFYAIVPTPADLDSYRRLADIGVDGVIMGPPVGPGATEDEHRSALMRFGEDVIAPAASL